MDALEETTFDAVAFQRDRAVEPAFLWGQSLGSGHTCADDVPAKLPSVLGAILAIAFASSVEALMI